MSSVPAESVTRPHSKWGYAALYGVAGALIVGVVVLAFLWPIATARPQNLPIAIAGPPASVAAVEKAAGSKSDGAIAFTTVADRAAAITRIKDRGVYGAIILPTSQGDTPEVLTATAASPAVAQLLTGVAISLQAQLVQQAAASGAPAAAVAGIHVTVTDIVPLASTDPTGSGLIAASFPLVLGGLLGGILISLLVVGVLRRLLALLVYALATGAVATLILQTLFGVLQGGFLVNALALSLAMLATASVIVGFTAVMGPRGIAVGSVITMLIGNPISGAAVPMQFLVGPWGAIGQYFVPGAASTLVRDLSYFPDVTPTAQWLTLAAWAALGGLLSVTGHFRNRATIALPSAELESEPTHRAVGDGGGGGGESS